MADFTAIIAIANFLIACMRCYHCLKGRRPMAMIWFLIAYFSGFFIGVAIGGPFTHIQGHTARALPITEEHIALTCQFIAAFNLVFLATEYGLGKLLRIGKSDFTWTLPRHSPALMQIILVFLALLLLGSLMYFLQTRNFAYHDYVEFQGSSWSQVLLWAASPLPAILAMRRQYIPALITSLPFIYFAFLMNIRSFALLSLVPVAAIYLLQSFGTGSTSLSRRLKTILVTTLLAIGLVFSSAFILSTKSGHRGLTATLPDSGMPAGAVIMMMLSDRYETRTGFDALRLYGRNLVNPFIKAATKLFHIELQEIIDPPYVMGRLFDDLPGYFRSNLHYPGLIYADAYMAFGGMGILLAIFWAAVLSSIEKVMLRNHLLFSLLIPFYSWHAYMLVRGATAGASVPISYALYITLLVALVLYGPALFQRRKNARTGTAGTIASTVPRNAHP
jgi:hypothetical protein